MPRVSAYDACIICEKVPCECGKKTARPRANPKPKKSVEETVTDPVQPVVPSRPSAIERMRARVREQAAEKMFALPSISSAPTGRLSEEDAATVHAVRVLSSAFEIHPDDLRPFKQYLDQPPSTHERAAWWRLRKRRGDAI